MTRRQTLGPETEYERTGAQLYRDPRTGGARFLAVVKGPASGFILAAAAIGVVAEPASIDILVPVSALYAAWVLTRRVVLPFRLPWRARRLDYNHPLPGQRRPRMSEGIIYLGNDYRTQQELWLGNEDGRQHVAVPGTTGAGKTEGLLSLVSNAFTHDSGFIFVDGKADNKLFAKVLALARKFGREDDVLALNFLVASGNKDSNTFNPFGSGNADVIRELLVSQIEENPRGGNTDSNHVFMGRAIALMGALTPVLVWLRDNRGVPIDIEKIRFATELQSIASLALGKRFRRLDVETGVITDMDVSDIPEAYLYPLRAYLGETGGFDASLPYNKQKLDEPARQHSFVTMHFSNTFTQLAVSLGHIFKCETGDIEMRDVVLNRRILVVNLPSLENSGETTAALGRIVVAALRNMMAQTLGVNLEGDYQEIVANKPSMARTPFPVVLDEVGYYVVPGMDKMLAMGRGLGFMFYLGFQEVAGLHARIGETMYSLLGNANLQILMRLQEGSETRRYVEQTAGDTNVMQANAFQATDMGYREARHAEVRRISRVEWTDLRGLIEGEAIMLFGSMRVHAKLFYAEVDPDGPMRLNRPLMLMGPESERGVGARQRIDAIRDAVRHGWARHDGEPTESRAILALVDGFCRVAADGGGLDDCVDAAIAAAAAIEPAAAPVEPASPRSGEIPPAPATELDPMLRSAEAYEASGTNAGLVVAAPVTDAEKQRDLARIEEKAGVPSPVARIAAKEALAARDQTGVGQEGASLSPMALDALCALIKRLNTSLAGIGKHRDRTDREETTATMSLGSA
jgi:intracellular multiplication protein IcmO